MDSFNDISKLLAEALAHHKAQRFDQAQLLYQRVLKLIPHHPDTTHLLGLCFHQLGRQSEAVTTLQRAVELNPSNPTYRNSLKLAMSARYDLGMLHATEGRAEEAIACFEHAVKSQPDHEQAWRALAGMMRDRKEYRRAAEAYEGAIRIAPNDPRLHFELGKTLFYKGDHQRAAEALRRSLALDPELKEAHYMLAALGEAPLPDAVPANVVAGLFDRYADKFESHLREELAYRTPEVMLDAIRRAGLPDRPLDILDAGCGTGLCGPLLRPLAGRLDGVDLSAEMVRHAAKKEVYDELIVGDLVQTLTERPGRYDLIVAADVFVYFGDLNAPFVAAARALRPGGSLALSVEVHEGESFILQRSGRFAHASAYVLSVAGEAGFRSVIAESTVLRQEEEKDVAGTVMVLQVAQ